MKTPLQELIDTFEEMNTGLNPSVDVRFVLSLLRSKLEKEKDLFCQFAKIYDDDLSSGFLRKVQDAFDETFRNIESTM